MTLCHCDGPPHEYDPSWCIHPKFDAGTRAAREYGSQPWEDTPYNRNRDADYRQSIPRNHGGVGYPPSRTAEQRLAALREYLATEAHWHEHGPFMVNADVILRIING